MGLSEFFWNLGAWNWFIVAVALFALESVVPGVHFVWFGVAVFPASNILFLSPVLVAERNLYIPSIGMAAAAGWLLTELFAHRRQAAVVATTAVVALMSLRTVTRNPVWNDTRGLFIDEIQRHPQSARAWFFHSDRLWREGMQAEARRAFGVLMLLTDSDYLYAVQVGSRLSGMERASPRAAEFFLKRRLYKRASNGNVIAREFVKLHYPLYWHYDILGALKIFAEIDFTDDERCADALDLLEEKALPSGGWPSESRYYKKVSSQFELGNDYVDWGGASTRRLNEWVTADALYVLQRFGRLTTHA